MLFILQVYCITHFIDTLHKTPIKVFVSSKSKQDLIKVFRSKREHVRYARSVSEFQDILHWAKIKSIKPSVYTGLNPQKQNYCFQREIFPTSNIKVFVQIFSKEVDNSKKTHLITILIKFICIQRYQ